MVCKYPVLSSNDTLVHRYKKPPNAVCRYCAQEGQAALPRCRPLAKVRASPYVCQVFENVFNEYFFLLNTNSVYCVFLKYANNLIKS